MTANTLIACNASPSGLAIGTPSVSRGLPVCGRWPDPQGSLTSLLQIDFLPFLMSTSSCELGQRTGPGARSADPNPGVRCPRAMAAGLSVRLGGGPRGQVQSFAKLTPCRTVNYLSVHDQLLVSVADSRVSV